jgi:hypothetical protein
MFNNNNQTYFSLSRTDRHTGAPVEVPPVLNKINLLSS